MPNLVGCVSCKSRYEKDATDFCPVCGSLRLELCLLKTFEIETLFDLIKPRRIFCKRGSVWFYGQNMVKITVGAKFIAYYNGNFVIAASSFSGMLRALKERVNELE